jgi:hypothetical protein
MDDSNTYEFEGVDYTFDWKIIILQFFIFSRAEIKDIFLFIGLK